MNHLDPILDKLVETVTRSDDLESLVRPLLELLESITGLESTYLTTIDTVKNIQKIEFSYNSREMNIPEGLEVAWDDTLCKRALDEERGYVDNVDACWGDSVAARQLGIMTYLSEPVRIGANKVYGTLCGASRAKVEVRPEMRRLLTMFAQLIARQLERDLLLAKLQDQNREFSNYALSDPLTGIPNRRALLHELGRALANAARTGIPVHVAFIDLDGFKDINDKYGHDAGDRLLIKIAQALTKGMRDGDFVARYGGDEFVMFGTTSSADYPASREALRIRVERLTTGQYSLAAQTLHYAGASVGVITTTATDRDSEAVLRRADIAMYEMKKLRHKKV